MKYIIILQQNYLLPGDGIHSRVSDECDNFEIHSL